MEPTLAQEYLLTHSLTELEEEHGVCFRVAEKQNYKVSLNYDQIKAKDSNPLACQCRGMVLRTWGPTPVDPAKPFGKSVILARPFDRFFNEGQVTAEKLDYSKACLFEKLDGTCCIVYFDDIAQEWHVATRSVPEADMPLNGGMTFRELFEKALEETNGMKFNEFTKSKLIPSFTYIFELTTPVNRVVVAYPKFAITLLGVRHNLSGDEDQNFHATAQTLGVPAPKQYFLNSLPDLVDFIKSNNPIEFEGIVAGEYTDNNWKRVKVKHPGYLALNRVSMQVTGDRNLLEFVLLGKDDDVRPVLSDYHLRRLDSIKEGLRGFLEVNERAYTGLRETHGNDRKGFALAVQANPSLDMTYLMSMWTGKSFGDLVKKATSTEGGISSSFLEGMIKRIEAQQQTV